MRCFIFSYSSGLLATRVGKGAEGSSKLLANTPLTTLYMNGANTCAIAAATWQKYYRQPAVIAINFDAQRHKTQLVGSRKHGTAVCHDCTVQSDKGVTV